MAVIPFELEEIHSSALTCVNRAKVPGGWLVMIGVHSHGGAHFTTNFIEDAAWDWELE